MFKVGIPWYDYEVVQKYTDEFWLNLRQHLVDQGFACPRLPNQLNRQESYVDHWNSEKLLLSQACGYNLVTGYGHQLKIVGAPSFNIEGLKPGRYFSYIVTSSNLEGQGLSDFGLERLVVNSRYSHSGMNAFKEAVAAEGGDLGHFSKVLVSGSHETSLKWVQEGIASLACIDCVSFHLFLEQAPEKLAGIKILQRTRDAAAPPFVTRANLSSGEFTGLQRALAYSIGDSRNRKPLESLLIKGIVFPELSDYMSMLDGESNYRRV